MAKSCLVFQGLIFYQTKKDKFSLTIFKLVLPILANVIFEYLHPKVPSFQSPRVLGRPYSGPAYRKSAAK